jgi:hypothetical protein
MLKSLLLGISGSLLVYGAQAQTTLKMVLPGEALVTTSAAPEVARGISSVIGQLQQALVQNYTANTWVDYSRTLYLRYATPTLPGQAATERKAGSAWSPYARHRYQYTTAGIIATDTVDQYYLGAYSPYFVYARTFTSPSQIQHEWQMNRFPGTTTPWDTTKRNTYTYNPAGQNTQVQEQFYSSGQFDDVARRLSTYNALGQVSVYETQSSDQSGGWEPVQRFTYTYNAAGKLQQAITEGASLSTGAYLNSARNTYQFDAQGRESILTTESWDNNTWSLSSQTLYTYDAFSNLAVATLQAWNPNTSAYQNYQRVLFTYLQVTGTRPATLATGVQLAPNPTAGRQATSLRYELQSAATPSVTILDLTGRTVATVPAQPQVAGAHALALPTPAAPGLYLVRLTTGTQSQTLKLIVE